MLHEEVVEKRKWVGEDRFQHALRYCTFLPGPEAQQLATCCGWYLHGIPGGLAAGILFFLPAAFLLWALSWIYAAYGQIPLITAAFHGLKAAVLAILAAAVIRLAKKPSKAGGRTPSRWGRFSCACIPLHRFRLSLHWPDWPAAACRAPDTVATYRQKPTMRMPSCPNRATVAGAQLCAC